MKDRTRSPYFPWLAAPRDKPPRDRIALPDPQARKESRCK
jgi:hypothetical protein